MITLPNSNSYTLAHQLIFFRFGRIDVEISGGTWNLKTSNIHRWHFEKPKGLPSRVIIDDQVFNIPPSLKSDYWFLASEDGEYEWSVSASCSFVYETPRSVSNYSWSFR